MAEGLKVRLEPIPGLTKRGLLPRTGFYFQCPPLEEFAVEHAYSHTDYDTVSGGQFSRRGSLQLRTVTFDTLLVDARPDLQLLTLRRELEDRDIEEMRDRLVKLIRSGSPFMLTAAHALPRRLGPVAITVHGPELQMAATLRTLRVAERAGEGDTRYLNAQFVEYRHPLVAESGKGVKRPGGAEAPTSATLFADGTAKDKSGRLIGHPPSDPVTLSRLAKFFYNDGTRWRAIARANGITDWGGHDALILYKTYKRLKLPSAGTPGRKPTKMGQATIKIPPKPLTKAEKVATGGAEAP